MLSGSMMSRNSLAASTSVVSGHSTCASPANATIPTRLVLRLSSSAAIWVLRARQPARPHVRREHARRRVERDHDVDAAALVDLELLAPLRPRRRDDEEREPEQQAHRLARAPSRGLRLSVRRGTRLGSASRRRLRRLSHAPTSMTSAIAGTASSRTTAAATRPSGSRQPPSAAAGTSSPIRNSTAAGQQEQRPPSRSRPCGARS